MEASGIKQEKKELLGKLVKPFISYTEKMFNQEMLDGNVFLGGKGLLGFFEDTINGMTELLEHPLVYKSLTSMFNAKGRMKDSKIHIDDWPYLQEAKESLYGDEGVFRKFAQSPKFYGQQGEVLAFRLEKILAIKPKKERRMHNNPFILQSTSDIDCEIMLIRNQLYHKKLANVY